MNLIVNLKWLADRWVEEQSSKRPMVSLKTLSSRSTNDGKLFDRIQAGRPVKIPTYERCLGFLSQSSNWPDGVIPGDVLRHIRALKATLSLPSQRPSQVIAPAAIDAPAQIGAAQFPGGRDAL